MERTFDQLYGRPLHCSYDIGVEILSSLMDSFLCFSSNVTTDAVDPLHAPSTGTAVRGGLTFREAHYLVEAVSGTGQLGSLDMVHQLIHSSL